MASAHGEADAEMPCAAESHDAASDTPAVAPSHNEERSSQNSDLIRFNPMLFFLKLEDGTLVDNESLIIPNIDMCGTPQMRLSSVLEAIISAMLILIW